MCQGWLLGLTAKGADYYPQAGAPGAAKRNQAYVPDRRLALRVGKAKAITATARKLAILVYRTPKGEIIYVDQGAAAYDQQRRDAILRRLRQRALTLGFELVNRGTGEPLEGGVS